MDGVRSTREMISETRVGRTSSLQAVAWEAAGRGAAYAAVGEIQFAGMQYRGDIGHRAIATRGP